MNWEFVAHIIRDVFDVSDGVVYFGTDLSGIEVLRRSEHGIETWGLCRSDDDLPGYCHNWQYDMDPSFFGYEFANLFFSFNYNPPLVYDDESGMAFRIARTLDKGGYVWAVGQSMWASKLGSVLRPRPDLAIEICRYSMFATQPVRVFQR